MNTVPKIGLVTVLYNGVELLEGFYKSLGSQTYKNIVLYVIDNSPDNIALDIAQCLSNKYNIESEFINNNDNLGVAKGNNQGIERSMQDSCDYTLLLNYDIEFGENAILNLVKECEENNENIVVPKIYYYGTNRIWMAGGDISLLRGIPRHRGENEEDNGQYNSESYIEYAPTCFMLVRQSVFNIIGKMDEIYFVYYDDVDFVYRARENQYKIKYTPTVEIHHKVSHVTGGSSSLFSIYYSNRNRLYFIKKNIPRLYKYIALIYFYMTRLIKLFLFNNKQRRVLIKAITDGRKM